MRTGTGIEKRSVTGLRSRWLRVNLVRVAATAANGKSWFLPGSGSGAEIRSSQPSCQSVSL